VGIPRNPEFHASVKIVRLVRALPGRGTGAGISGWCARFVVACTGAVSYALGPFGLRGLPSASVGFLIALLVLLAELRLRRAALSGLLGGAFGAVLGVFAALLVTLVVSRTDEPEPTKSFLEFAALFAFGYLGLVLGSGRGRELRVDAMEEFFGKKTAPSGSVKLLDTSVLIDGRIADICEAQFLEGVLGVPQFVLRELQMVADSSDSLKRQRGRRGLEVLQRIQKMPQVGSADSAGGLSAGRGRGSQTGRAGAGHGRKNCYQRF